MANYMEQVAKMLGVELYEEFEIVFPNNLNCHATALLNKERLYIKDHNLANQDNWQLTALTHLLNGSYGIKRKPWKPCDDSVFWYITQEGSTILAKWNYDATRNLSLYKLGNCYRTHEEAEANIDKWVAFYKSDEVLEV